MFYLEAPDIMEWRGPSVFLAGGITGCPDWQSEAVSLLTPTNLTVYNPRRADFPMGDPSEGKRQIRWEFDHLRRATYVLFWFPCETLCPISLYELGAWAMTSKPLYVGVHPMYQRRLDVEEQLKLVRPKIRVSLSLEDTIVQLLDRYQRDQRHVHQGLQDIP